MERSKYLSPIALIIVNKFFFLVVKIWGCYRKIEMGEGEIYIYIEREREGGERQRESEGGRGREGEI